MKKLLSSLLLLAMMVGSIYSVNGADVSNWHEFAENGNIISTNSPDTLATTKVEWSKDFTSGWDSLSDPIIVNDQIFVASGTDSKLYKLDLNGNILAQMTLADYLGFSVNIAYGDGMIFVALGNGCVQAIDANTMTSLWISEAADYSLQGKFTYYDGYLYFGSYINDWVDYTSNGSFYALKTEDIDKTSPNETKTFAWSYQSTQNKGGYNWAKAVVYQDVLYFAGIDGKVVAHDLKTSNVIDTYEANGGVSSALTLVGNQLYFTTQTGHIYALSINQDHTFGTAVSNSLGANSSSTSAPTVYNGRVYVGGGQGYGNPGFISVLDAKTLETIYKLDTTNDVQAAPLVTTAYDNQVIAYFTTNIEPGGLYALVDNPNTNTGKIETIYTPTGDAANYCMTSAIADAYGSLYHFNDSGYLTKLSKVEEVIKEEITLTSQDVQVQGNFIKGTRLDITKSNNGQKVDSLLNQYKQLEKLTIYDFSLTLDNLAVEPTDLVKVTIPLPSDYNQEGLKLYYLNSDSTLVEYAYTIDNQQLTFTTNHFSSYVLAQTKEETSTPEQTPPSNNQQDQPSNDKQVPLTGDKTNQVIYLIVAGVAIVGIIVVVVMGKKKK